MKLKDLNELFADLRELGYEPYISNGHIEIDKKEDNETWNKI